ncbi:hypothetical protein JCM24511_09696 [Saitozyma sp. JCM 24511]|nr:hypothetical protein JCM24511_09696 [Saitozyma sp. JCM 24511]
MPDSPSSAGSRRGPESEHGQAPKKKRKQRQTFACSGTYRPGSRRKCRRLKMKCDRQGSTVQQLREASVYEHMSRRTERWGRLVSSSGNKQF